MSDFWPHQFAPHGEAKKIGEEQVLDKLVQPIMAQPMVCVHCNAEWLRNKEPQPQGACPARTDKRELKRIQDKTQGKTYER